MPMTNSYYDIKATKDGYELLGIRRNAVQGVVMRPHGDSQLRFDRITML
jgi:hypothetical protein